MSGYPINESSSLEDRIEQYQALRDELSSYKKGQTNEGQLPSRQEIDLDAVYGEEPEQQTKGRVQ